MFLKYFNREINSNILPILEEENSRNARQIAFFRSISTFLWLAMSVVMGIFYKQDDWRIPIPALLIYFLISLLILRGTKINSKLHWLIHWSAPLVDIPFIFASIYMSINIAPYPQIGAIVMMTIFLLFIIPAPSGIRHLPSIVAGISSLLFTLYLIDYVGVKFPTWVASISLIYTFAVLIAINVSRRPIIVASAFAQEQNQRSKLARYFSPSVSDVIMNQRKNQSYSNPEVSVLFADIRGFTSYSESESSENVVKFLNAYLTRMVSVIFKYGGTLDKFMGDGILAYFGAPIDQPDHAKKAIECAIEMQKEMDSINLEIKNITNKSFQIGIGIHSGRVVLGDIGPEQRKEFTIIGDTVNLASRVESLTKDLDSSILVTLDTYNHCSKDFTWKNTGEVNVRGKKEKIQLFSPSSS
ncbi:adenylate/guanylate cyclase domain-containing protein [Leptospira sp. GIMC2001]|uniref:adenylate/guanylate cyclase domain-containing protein n=1 Tax=Leptospira sp. GIMC2001 TaxID=1513297 RepID=UPI00234BC8D4|nr:adenylate/guanylate cyclase domain-containing protein [Leptospira sp. GIMC2001]WCL50207.1 adenylate/guanylate cyclase domain-containing protein [Leptospira sp. GIMC2001]